MRKNLQKLNQSTGIEGKVSAEGRIKGGGNMIGIVI